MLGFVSSLSVFDAFKPCWLKCLCQASSPLECSLLNLQFLHGRRSLVSSSYHSDLHRCSRVVHIEPFITTDNERFLAEVSTTQVPTTGVSTTEMFTVGVSPDINSDEYYYQSSESKNGFFPNAELDMHPVEHCTNMR